MMNLHNHTTFSDGRFSPRDIIEAAVRFGLGVVGISDHYWTTRTRSIAPGALGDYTDHIRRLAPQYKNRVKVLVGIEIDACPERTQDLETLPYEQLNRLDFVLFEHVQEEEVGGVGLWELFDKRKELEPPVGLAHNDIGRNFAGVDPSVLIPVLETNRIFLELCPSLRHARLQRPLYRHSSEFFARLKGTRVGLSIGTDTHESVEEVGAVSDPMDFVRELQLERNLLRWVQEE
ncbi:MAG: PHP domain-containing protein [Thermoplasmatota archaeon]